MSAIAKITALGAATLLLGGCFNGSNNNGSQPDPAVDFTAFVKTQFDRTSATAAPASVNNVDLSFNDQNNPQAFDDLLQ
ncbi:MAG TPA: hypothetical protein VFN01_02035 [Marinobacter sp.]|uniref:hypothetical protein n=1 Tax=Marinobacter sp. TaxID=50741 RepID=UPI0026286737|nr:hypothetical protein [Marinobacter sp.]HET8799938.1 hypothetical protein [Marinobacter sp.]